MDHEQFQRLILDHGWTKLALEQAALVHAHVKECPQCAEALADYDRMRDVLALPAADETPAGGWSAYEDRLHRQMTPRTRTMRWWSGGAAIAALLLIVVGAWVYRPAGHDATDVEQYALLPEDPEQQASAFQSISQVFDGRAGWMVMSNGEAGLGLMNKPLMHDTPLILLRLTMTDHNGIIAQTDVAIVPGQQANVSVPVGNRTIHYRMTPSPSRPNRVALWAEIESAPQAEAMDVVAANLDMRGNQVVRAGVLSAYELNVGYREAQLEYIQ